MTNLHRLKFVVLLSLFTSAVVPAAPAADEAAPQDNPPRVTLNFPGGTLEEFVQALETASGGPVNLVMPDRSDVPVPAIRVADVSLDQVFAALNGADSNIIFKAVMTETNFASKPYHRSTIWAVLVAPTRTEPQMARSFSVERLLEKYNINDLTTAIRTAWEMARVQQPVAAFRDNNPRYWNLPGPPPELRFHQETRLLIVRGTFNDLELAEGVIKQLSPPVKAEQTVLARSPEELAALQKIKTDLEVERQTILAKITEIEDKPPGSAEAAIEMPGLRNKLRDVERRIKNIEAVAAKPPN